MPLTAVRATNIKVGFDFDGDGVADPGDVLQHSLIITNTEVTQLLDVVVQESQTGITTIPGSAMIGPIANNDGFNMVGNTSITITKAQLIGNDIDPDGAEANMTVTIDLASDVNGVIIDNGNNTYTFTPNVGFEGTASFEYSLTDEQGVTSVPVATIDGLVSIAVEDMVWFIDNTRAGQLGTARLPGQPVHLDRRFQRRQHGAGPDRPRATSSTCAPAPIPKPTASTSRRPDPGRPGREPASSTIRRRQPSSSKPARKARRRSSSLPATTTKASSSRPGQHDQRPRHRHEQCHRDRHRGRRRHRRHPDDLQRRRRRQLKPRRGVDIDQGGTLNVHARLGHVERRRQGHRPRHHHRPVPAPATISPCRARPHQRRDRRRHRHRQFTRSTPPSPAR